MLFDRKGHSLLSNLKVSPFEYASIVPQQS
jgi:hypothetical protein